ncbi:uncharacterized protein O3C94_020093 [Discoglossus pictus]
MSNYNQTFKRVVSVERSTPTLTGGNYGNVGTTRYSGSVYGGAGGYGTRISSSSFGGSVYGGAGGYGTRLPSTSGFSGGLSSSFQITTNTDGLLSGNEKETMQNLNDRLATYLDKVRSLEKANSHLEVQIREWYSKNSFTADRDYNNYYQIIEDLKNKILGVTLDNARILLQIDNARLAADDFRLKFENEQALRVSVEKDIFGLRKVIDDLSITRADIELQIEALQEELAYLKKNHEEEVGVLRNQVGGTVNVEVDAAPAVDLAKVLADMRIQCETVVEKVREEAKRHFGTKIEEVSVQITTNTAEIESSRTTIVELQRSVQGLEIELQSELSKKDALSATLENVNAQYAAKLSQIQGLITNLEAQLVQIRYDMNRQTQEYEVLLNIKIRLEYEIATYRRLLEGEDESWAELEEKLKEQSRSRKIKTIVEEMIDGKVVSSQVKEVEEKMRSPKGSVWTDEWPLDMVDIGSWVTRGYNGQGCWFIPVYHYLNIYRTEAHSRVFTCFGKFSAGCIFSESTTMYKRVSVKRVAVKKNETSRGSTGGGSYNTYLVGGYASSVYAGAGGLGTRISGATSHGVATGSTFKTNSRESLFSGNEKEVMQNLNSRLGNYMNKVHSLQTANAQLEGQIKDWYSKNTTGKRDDNPYYKAIEDLKKQIFNVTVDNTRILLETDNARLAAEDFKMKFENEQIFRASVENDIVELRKTTDQLTITKADLETQIENLSEELMYLKKNHAEEMEELGKQASSTVDVQVDAKPSVDLGKIMEDMRAQYEQIVEKQRLEAKYIYDKKVEEWNLEKHIDIDVLEKCKREEKDIRHKAQELEIELQAEISKRTSVSTTLEAINGHFFMELGDIQHAIMDLEAQLQQTRRDIGHQIRDYELLLDLKTKLEAEITTYQSLLDGEDSKTNRR